MQDKQRLIFTTLMLEVGFLVPDTIAAVLAGSLAVWADLLRCGIETLAVFFAWLTIRKVDRASSDPQRYEYGLGKLESMSTVLIATISSWAPPGLWWTPGGRSAPRRCSNGRASPPRSC